jgi:ABC-type multidrug transport system ATPase subunit
MAPHGQGLEAADHEILLALKRDGRTILLSSHYPDEIEMLADRLIILAAGQDVADGTPRIRSPTASGRC